MLHECEVSTELTPLGATEVYSPNSVYTVGVLAVSLSGWVTHAPGWPAVRGRAKLLCLIGQREGQASPVQAKHSVATLLLIKHICLNAVGSQMPPTPW